MKNTEEDWENKLVKCGGSCDITVSPINTNHLKKWCKSNNYICKFFTQYEDTFTYVVAKNHELYLKHEQDR